jgi:hypothetical protein
LVGGCSISARPPPVWFSSNISALAITSHCRDLAYPFTLRRYARAAP